MKASTSNDDFVGTAAADISKKLDNGPSEFSKMDLIGKYFHIDETRYKALKLSISFDEEISYRIHCHDKMQSTFANNKYVILRIEVTKPKGVLRDLFDQLNIELVEEYDKSSENLPYVPEIPFKPTRLG